MKKKRRRKSPSAASSHKPAFIGIDLAWSRRNPSGCAIIRDERLVAYTGSLTDDREIISFISTHLEDERPAVVGIDAPLRVPNESGSRPCDRALSADWRQFEAGALPANRKLFARMTQPKNLANIEGTVNLREEPFAQSALQDNSVRGEVITALLVERLRFTEAAIIPRRVEDRLVCEIYPHPAHVSLFDLERTLKYKARSGRDYPSRWREFERYQTHLRNLRWQKPKLKRTKDLLTKTDVTTMRGKALKEYEDTLDAITCAYVVYYLWYFGPAFARTYGTLEEGHIIVPMTEKFQNRFGT